MKKKLDVDSAEKLPSTPPSKELYDEMAKENRKKAVELTKMREELADERRESALLRQRLAERDKELSEMTFERQLFHDKLALIHAIMKLGTGR